MRLSPLALPLSLTLAAPALAETDIRQLLIDTAIAHGCVITEAVAEAEFPALGLTPDQVGPVAQEMVLAGEADNANGDFVLSPDLCGADGAADEAAEDTAADTADAPPTDAPLPELSPLMARVIDVFRDNGCTMDEATGMAAFAEVGISEAELDTLNTEGEALAAAGFLVIDGSGTITVAEPLCSAGE